MVVADFNFFRINPLPLETDAPLIVDTDAPLSFAVANKFLEPIPGWHPKSLNLGGRSNHIQLSKGNTSHCREPSAGSVFIQNSSVLIRKRRNHITSILRNA